VRPCPHDSGALLVTGLVSVRSPLVLTLTLVGTGLTMSAAPVNALAADLETAGTEPAVGYFA
jgi:hypothetical protein